LTTPGHDAVAGATGCDGDEFFLPGGSAPGDRIPAAVWGGLCGPGDAVGAGHDAVACSAGHGDEFFLPGGSAPCNGGPVVVGG